MPPLCCSAALVELQLHALSAAHAEALVAVVGAAGLLDAAAAAELRELEWLESVTAAVLSAAANIARYAPTAFSPFVGTAVEATVMQLVEVRRAQKFRCCCQSCSQLAPRACLNSAVWSSHAGR